VRIAFDVEVFDAIWDWAAVVSVHVQRCDEGIESK
jgi:hypothetical protein